MGGKDLEGSGRAGRGEGPGQPVHLSNHWFLLIEAGSKTNLLKGPNQTGMVTGQQSDRFGF